jgi:hypothetical protein
MPRLDFTPRVGPFRFNAKMGMGCWSALGWLFLAAMAVLCCCGGFIVTFS